MFKNFVLLWVLLSTSISYAGNQIFCPFCKKHLYDYKYDIQYAFENKMPLKAENFTPLNGAPIIPLKTTQVHTFLKCPYDNAPLNGYLYWFWERGLHEPTLFYPALTLLTIDQQGDFVWEPYEVELEE